MTPPRDRHRRLRAAAKIFLGSLGLAALILWSGGMFLDKLPAGTVAAEGGFELPEGARVVEAVSEMVAPQVDLVGTVASGEKIVLSARISAYVKEVFVSAGDMVTQGQLLIRLDDRELRQQLAAAQARLQQARREYDRARKLMAAEATTDQALTAARTGYEAAAAQVRQLEVTLSDTEIRAPIDGRVTDRRVEAGDLASPGQPLLGVYAPRNLRIEVPVPVRLVRRLRLGQAVAIELDAAEKPYTGRVTEVVGEIDPLSRTQRMKVHIEGAGEEVLPGTFGRVWVEDAPRPAILVPAACVYRVGQLELVQVVEDHRVLRRLVKTGPRHGDRVEILSGLSAGERLLAEPVKG